MLLAPHNVKILAAIYIQSSVNRSNRAADYHMWRELKERNSRKT